MFRAENEGQLQCTYLQAEWISLMSLLLIISCCINVATHLAQIITKKMLCENKLKEKRQVFFSFPCILRILPFETITAIFYFDPS